MTDQGDNASSQWPQWWTDDWLHINLHIFDHVNTNCTLRHHGVELDQTTVSPHRHVVHCVCINNYTCINQSVSMEKQTLHNFNAEDASTESTNQGTASVSDNPSHPMVSRLVAATALPLATHWSVLRRHLRRLCFILALKEELRWVLHLIQTLTSLSRFTYRRFLLSTC